MFSGDGRLSPQRACGARLLEFEEALQGGALPLDIAFVVADVYRSLQHHTKNLKLRPCPVSTLLSSLTFVPSSPKRPGSMMLVSSCAMVNLETKDAGRGPSTTGICSAYRHFCKIMSRPLRGNWNSQSEWSTENAFTTRSRVSKLVLLQCGTPFKSF